VTGGDRHGRDGAREECAESHDRLTVEGPVLRSLAVESSSRQNSHPDARATPPHNRDDCGNPTCSEPLTITYTHSSELAPASSMSVGTASTINHKSTTRGHVFADRRRGEVTPAATRRRLPSRAPVPPRRVLSTRRSAGRAVAPSGRSRPGGEIDESPPRSTPTAATATRSW